jgi:phosphoglycerate dehydrogenase-like enzyme
MTRLLVFEPSFAGIESALAKWAGAVEPALIDRAGEITLAGARLTREEAAPEIAWFSGDLYQQPAMAPFIGAVLASPGLKWLQSAAAGFDHPIFARIAAKGAKLTTSHGQAVGMADFVLAEVLDHFQRGPERRAAQARREWKGHPFREVLGSTWLIIGFGAVGQGVARRAKGFGARVIGARRHQAPHPDADLIIPPEAVSEHLPAADVVVLCAPLSPATRHLVDEAFFAAMKPGAVIANVGRGALIDETALLAALDRGVPSRAILDVFETEPLPSESPFWAHPRVSLSPHASGVTGAQDGRNRDLFLDNLARYFDGRPLLNEVDPKDLEAG